MFWTTVEASQRCNRFSAVAQGLLFNYEGGNAGPLPLKSCLTFSNVAFLSWFRSCSKIPLIICKWLHLETLLKQGSLITNDCAYWNCKMFVSSECSSEFYSTGLCEEVSEVYCKGWMLMF